MSKQKEKNKVKKRQRFLAIIIKQNIFFSSPFLDLCARPLNNFSITFVYGKSVWVCLRCEYYKILYLSVCVNICISGSHLAIVQTSYKIYLVHHLHLNLSLFFKHFVYYMFIV